MDTRLNIFTQRKQVEFILVSLCHNQFIEYRHYCLSLARLSDMKIITVQECHGLSWNLQNILFNKRRQGKMGSLLVPQLFIWEPLNIFIVVFSFWIKCFADSSLVDNTLALLLFSHHAVMQVKGNNDNIQWTGRGKEKRVWTRLVLSV